MQTMKERAPLVIIGGLDGSGKSTTAQGAAATLSSAYPERRITVTDSNGIYTYHTGNLIDHRSAELEQRKPVTGTSRMRAAFDLGIFAMQRRALNVRASANSDLVLSVRDPHRIEPALYAGIYGPSRIKELSPYRRLQVIDRVVRLRPAAAVVYLDSSVDTAREARDARQDETMQPHETTQNLQIVADELPYMLGAYSELFQAKGITVAAMQPQTIDQVSASVERYLEPRVGVA